MSSLRPPSLPTAAAGLLGLFYLLSGVGKALDMGQFTETIAGYGLPRLAVLAPGLIALEIGLGVALLLRVQRRAMALLSLGLLVLFTALFAQAYLVRGVRDCGCFGAIDALALPPALSFLRNALLIALSAWLYRRSPVESGPVGALRPRLVLLAAVLSLGAASVAYARRSDPNEAGVIQGQAVRGSRLAPYLPVKSDSTYLVFVFSPSCSHCWHATPTVATYQGQGVVDRVVALYAATDTAATGRYQRTFRPPFALHAVDLDARRAIAPRVPLAVLVRHGIVLRVFKPPLPSADSLQALLASAGPR